MKTAVLVSLLVVSAQSLSAQKREVVVPVGQQASGMLSPGIRVGNIIYASGQLGSRSDTTIGGQTRTALESTKKVFEAAGTTMDQTIKCTVFLVDVKDFAGMNAAYREFFPAAPPARSTVVVAALVVSGAKVEIECFAAIPPK
jgi:2-iminobutanoate/2-iminopropanoate deaminase